MTRISVRALAASAIVGVACGLAFAPSLHARPAPQGPADGPAPMSPDPSYATPGRASHRIGVAFPTATAKTPAGAVILTRDAAGRVVLDIKRQGFNNLEIGRSHRALVQFFREVPRGQKREGADLLPLHEFELPAMTLRPGGVDNFNVASREGFVVPPGDYSLVVATAFPTLLDLPPEERLAEKDPKGAWMVGNSFRYSVSVR